MLLEEARYAYLAVSWQKMRERRCVVETSAPNLPPDVTIVNHKPPYIRLD